jgi:hypothetical protein
MAELVDALDLGSSTARCEGSSPFVRIDLFPFPWLRLQEFATGCREVPQWLNAYLFCE